jgi:hypothetical protein
MIYAKYYLCNNILFTALDPIAGLKLPARWLKMQSILRRFLTFRTTLYLQSSLNSFLCFPSWKPSLFVKKYGLLVRNEYVKDSKLY